MSFYTLFSFAGYYVLITLAEFALAAKIFGNVKTPPHPAVGMAITIAMLAFPAWLAWGMATVAIYTD